MHLIELNIDRKGGNLLLITIKANNKGVTLLKLWIHRFSNYMYSSIIWIM